MFNKIKRSPREKFTKIIKKRETILSLYFGWRLRVILEKTTERLRGPFRTHKQYVLATLTLIFLISGSLVIKNYYFSQAATYEWTQTAWTTQTSNTHTHTNEMDATPPLQGSWVEYSAVDSSVSTGNSVSIIAETTSLEHTLSGHFSAGTSQGTLTTGDQVSLDLP